MPVIVSNFNYFYNRETGQEDLDSINVDHVKACPYWPDTSNRYEVRRLSLETSKESNKYPLSRRESDLSTWNSRIPEYLLRDRLLQVASTTTELKKIETSPTTSAVVDYLDRNDENDQINETNEKNSTNKATYCMNCKNRLNSSYSLRNYYQSDLKSSTKLSPENSLKTTVKTTTKSNQMITNLSPSTKMTNSIYPTTASISLKTCSNCLTFSTNAKQFCRQFSKEFSLENAPILNLTSNSDQILTDETTKTITNSLINLDDDDDKDENDGELMNSFEDKRTKSSQELNPIDSTTMLMHSCSCNSIKEKHQFYHSKG